MPEGKAKFIEDCARLCEQRADVLEAEFERDKHRQTIATNAADRAAFMELRHTANLIRCLALAPYRGEPHAVAYKRWGRGDLQNARADWPEKREPITQ